MLAVFQTSFWERVIKYPTTLAPNNMLSVPNSTIIANCLADTPPAAGAPGVVTIRDKGD